MQVRAWTATEGGRPMVLEERDETPGAGEVVVRVAGCGVCHTDLGFFYDGVPTRHAFPLTLGHEVAGTVVEAGPGAEGWLGKPVVVPAVIPCGVCDACRAGRGAVCPKQIFPGKRRPRRLRLAPARAGPRAVPGPGPRRPVAQPARDSTCLASR